jgi:hypothetical protein
MSQVNCALVNIIGSGGGTPTGFIKFPNAYDVEDPGKRHIQAMILWSGLNV